MQTPLAKKIAPAYEDSVIQELRQIPILSPWMNLEIVDDSLNDDEYKLFRQRVQAAVNKKIKTIYIGLKNKTKERNAQGMLDTHSNQTRLQNTLLVQVQKRVDVEEIALGIKNKMIYHATVTKDRLECGQNKVQVLVAETQALSVVWDKKKGARSSFTGPHRTGGYRRKKKSTHSVVIRARSQFSSRYRSHGNHLLRGAFMDAQLRREVMDATESDEFLMKPQDEEGEEDKVTSRPILEERESLILHFPERDERTLHQLVEEQTKADKRDPLRFQNRPLPDSAIDDVGQPMRERKVLTRKRYLGGMSISRIRQTQDIMEQYPISKETIASIEKHRQMEQNQTLDEATTETQALGLDDLLVSVIQPVPIVENIQTRSINSIHVSREKKKEDFELGMSLASLRDSKSEKDRSHEFQLQVEELLTPLNQVSEQFHKELYEPLPLHTVLEKVLTTSLVNPIELPQLSKPERLQPILIPPTSPSTQSYEDLVTFTCLEQRALNAFLADDPRHSLGSSFTPIPWSPAISNRMDELWRKLKFPSQDSFDMALKYTNPGMNHRLEDAMYMWEVAAERVGAHEAGLKEIWDKINLEQDVDQDDMILELADASKKVRQMVVLIFDELNDFVTYEGIFYLEKMKQDYNKLQDTLGLRQSEET